MDALSILQRLGSGKLLEDIHEALTVTAQEVVATGKAAKVTVTLYTSIAFTCGRPLRDGGYSEPLKCRMAALAVTESRNRSQQ